METRKNSKKNPFDVDFRHPEKAEIDYERLLRDGAKVYNKHDKEVEVFNQGEKFYLYDDKNQPWWFSPHQDIVRTPRKHPDKEKGSFTLQVTESEISSGSTAKIQKISREASRAKHDRVVKDQTHFNPQPNSRQLNIQGYLPKSAAEKEEKYGKHLHAKRVIHLGSESDAETKSYVVMDDVGVSLQEILDEGRLTNQERMLIAIGIAKAYQTQVFAQGIVHQDIKPDNIMIDLNKLGNVFSDDTISRDYPVKFIDFSTAKEIGDPEISAPASPGYIAPETGIIENEEVDTRTDMYSLGIVLAQVFKEREPGNAYDYAPFYLTTLFLSNFPALNLGETYKDMIGQHILDMLEVNYTLRPHHTEALLSDLIDIYEEISEEDWVQDSLTPNENIREEELDYGIPSVPDVYGDKWRHFESGEIPEEDIPLKFELGNNPNQPPRKSENRAHDDAKKKKPSPPQQKELGFWDQHGEKILAATSASALVGSGVGAVVGVLITLGVIPLTFGLSPLILPITIPAGAAIGAGAFGAIGFAGSLLWSGATYLFGKKTQSERKESSRNDETLRHTPPERPSPAASPSPARRPASSSFASQPTLWAKAEEKEEKGEKEKKPSQTQIRRRSLS